MGILALGNKGFQGQAEAHLLWALRFDFHTLLSISWVPDLVGTTYRPWGDPDACMKVWALPQRFHFLLSADRWDPRHAPWSKTQAYQSSTFKTFAFLPKRLVVLHPAAVALASSSAKYTPLNSTHVCLALRSLPRLCPEKKCICQAQLFLGSLNTFCSLLAAFILFSGHLRFIFVLSEPGASLRNALLQDPVLEARPLAWENGKSLLSCKF